MTRSLLERPVLGGLFSSVFAALFSVLLVQAAIAQDNSNAVMPMQFATEQQRLRYQEFSKVLRCPMCQNQNLSGSDAGISADLRRELHRLIVEEKTDDEVIEFMQSRYGNFILYDPPLNTATSLLWFGPIIFLVFGFLTLFFMVRRQGQSSANQPVLSPDEKDRARAKLNSQDASEQ